MQTTVVLLLLCVLAFIHAGNQPTNSATTTGKAKSMSEVQTLATKKKSIGELKEQNVTSLKHLPQYSYGAPTYLGPHNNDVGNRSVIFTDLLNHQFVSCQVDCYSVIQQKKKATFLYTLTNPHSFVMKFT
jgi:hypothetical protein